MQSSVMMSSLISSLCRNSFSSSLNNSLADLDTKVYENFTVETRKMFGEENDAVKEEVPENDSVENSFPEEKQESEESGTSEEVHNIDIHVVVNDTPVTLTGKSRYAVVDIFLVYDFDLSKPQGSGVAIEVNGQKTDYSSFVADGDIIKIYWEQ